MNPRRGTHLLLAGRKNSGGFGIGVGGGWDGGVIGLVSIRLSWAGCEAVEEEGGESGDGVVGRVEEGADGFRVNLKS